MMLVDGKSMELRSYANANFHHAIDPHQQQVP